MLFLIAETQPLEATTSLGENIHDAIYRLVAQMLDGTRIVAELKTFAQDFMAAG